MKNRSVFLAVSAMMAVVLLSASISHSQTLAEAGTTSTLAKTIAAAQPDHNGRIPVVGFRFRKAWTDNAGVTLSSPATASPEQYQVDPSLRDGVNVVLTPGVVAQLKDLGVDDIAAHFKDRALQVRGKRTEVLYTGFPALIVYTVTVDRLEDIRVIDTQHDRN